MLQEGGETMKTGNRRRFARYAIPFMVLLMTGSACGGGGNNVGATLSNFKIVLDKSSAKTGDVTFKIKNDGPSTHEFVVFKTDLAPDALPTTTADNGATIVDEEGQGLEAVDEKEDIPSGSSTSLAVTLSPGKYVLICNIEDDGGHYKNGMHVGFTVSA
jgi:uncharacterized cupredoxin-like copper-binding protein